MLVAISQDNGNLGVKGYVDFLENNYFNYFKKFGFNLIRIPNGSDLNFYFDNLSIEAVILTGGTDIGENLLRDETEKNLLDFALRKRTPLLGICRGLQFINHYFGGSLIKGLDERSHVNLNHNIILRGEFNEFFEGNMSFVNSFHRQGVSQESLSSELGSFAKTEDGIIEGLYHPNYPLAGIQWHPERKSPDEKLNQKILIAFSNKQLHLR